MADDLPRKAEIPLSERADFQLGDALVRPSIRTIEGPDGTATAEPRVMQVLLVVAAANGNVVSRDELIRRCWNGRIVGDDSVNRAIAEVRRLARHTGSAFGIETIPRIGYRLAGATVQAEASKSTAVSLVSRRWIIGGALAASAGAAGLFAWQRQRSNDGFVPLVESAHQGMRYGTPRKYDEAAALLQKAIAVRPRDATAWGLLAMARVSIAEFARPEQSAAAVEAARRAAKQALLLDPDEPNARAAMIELQDTMLDRASKEDRLRQVLVSDPHNLFVLSALVGLLQAAGLDKASWNLNERAIAIEPMIPTLQYRRALKFWIFGRAVEADRAITRVRELWPEHPWVWNARFLIFAFTGRARAAQAMIDNSRSRPESILPLAITTWTRALTALDQRTPANIAAASDAIRAASRVSTGLAAHGVMMLSSLGELDAAYDVANAVLLSRGSITVQPAVEAKRQLINNPGWKHTQWLFTPPCAPFRDDPRFGALCDGLGLTDYWRKRGVRPDYLSRRA